MDCIGFVRNPFIQFVVFRFPGCSFIGICLVQGSESISHILVDGSDALHQIVIHSLDHLVLGCIGTKTGSRFFGQSSIQVGYILTDSLICFDDGSVLYRCISLAHSLVFQIFLHIGDAGIQFFIPGFDFIMDPIGFVCNAFVQFRIGGFPGLFFCSYFPIGIRICCIGFFRNGLIGPILGIYYHGRRLARCRLYLDRIRCPGEVWTHKGCCHQQSCGQFLQSLSCGFALGVSFCDFRCHHIGVFCFTPDDFIDLIHIDTLL